MTLIRERSVWSWAEKIAYEFREPFELVCAELLTAIDSGELPATYPHAPNAQWRRLGPIPEIVRNQRAITGEPLPSDRGIALLMHRIMVRDSDMKSWLSARKLPPAPPTTPEIARKSGGNLPEARDRARAAGAKSAIPAPRLKEFLEKIKAEGGQIPVADSLVENIQNAFPGYRVTRADVRIMCATVWGRQRRGPRRKNSAT